MLAVAIAISAAAVEYRSIDWEELIPAWWKPGDMLMELQNYADDDPRAEKVWQRFIKEWEQAPINRDFIGASIKLPGYVAPLEWEDNSALKEFLLVPYFGACIHVPPPPRNQIIYVKLDKPLREIHSMDVIWVYGKLIAEDHDSGSMGASSYRLIAHKIEPWSE
ncbi:MAG: DUF3299 domain-containing protein [Helicobacteraceae bacterium]|nr:DUF3299 domain-containing protein [Helicobacteraceae bacterium]